LFSFFFTLLGNFTIALLRIPITITFFSIFIRDILPFFLIFLSSIIYFESKKQKILFVYILVYFVFLIFLSLVNGSTLPVIFNQFRIVFAIPLIVYISNYLFANNSLINLDKTIKVILLLFLIVLIIEIFFLIRGEYSSYLKIINYKQYMLSKGTESGYGGGFFSYRLITPIFNSSVGGAICAWLAFMYYNKKKIKSFFYVFLTIMCLSKTGILLLFILIFFKRFFYLKVLIGTIFILFFTFIDVSLITFLFKKNIVLEGQVSSIKYHLNGLKTGIEYFFSPQGIGNSGTIASNLSSTNIGRESAVGNISGSLGFFVIPLYLTSILTVIKNKSVFKIISLYFFIGLINEATGPFYFWIVIILLNRYAKNNSYNYI
jgi:hypothetical protein